LGAYSSQFWKNVSSLGPERVGLGHGPKIGLGVVLVSRKLWKVSVSSRT